MWFRHSSSTRPESQACELSDPRLNVKTLAGTEDLAETRSNDFNNHTSPHEMSLEPSLPSIRLETLSIGQFTEEVCEQGLAITLIACCSRSYFLEQLVEHTQPDLHAPEDDYEPPSERPADADEEGDESLKLPPRKNPLLLPTIKLIAASSHVKLAFCPTIPIFRAYLSTLPVRAASDDTRPPKIVILNMLAVHHGTSEFTVQGLSRSFSMIASMNHVFRGRVELLECTDNDDLLGTGGSSNPWNAEVPLLSGSIKIGDAGQGFARRTVSISRFADRWFNFE